MLFRFLLSLITALTISVPFIESLGTVTFDCTDSEEHCPGEPVEYQCTVTGRSPLGLRVLIWRVCLADGTQLGTESYVNLALDRQPDTIAEGVFTTEQLSRSPIISNISFTVQSSINGYLIICEDGVEESNRFCSVNIREPPPPPEDIRTTIIDPATISVSWTRPLYNSKCFSVSSYSVLSNVADSTITTTDTSVDIPLAGLSPGVYCVSVATVDTVNRTGNYSDEECVELNVPAMVGIIDHQLFADPDDPTNAIVRLTWTFAQPSINPPLSSVYVSYNSSDEYFVVSLAPSSEVFELTLPRGNRYSVFISGGNVLGNGTGARLDVYIDSSMVLPSLPSPPTSLPSIPSPSTPVTTSTPLVSSLTSVSSSKVVVQVVVPIGIVLAVGILVTVGVVVLVVVLMSKRANGAKFKQQSSIGHSSAENHYAEVGRRGSSTSIGTQNSIIGTDKLPPSAYADIHHFKPRPSNGQGGSRGGSVRPSLEDRIEYVDIKCVTTAQQS